MRQFDVSACRREYRDPADRRFHAQPNACPPCGPRVRLLRVGDGAGEPIELSTGTAGDPSLPLRMAGELLRAGEILAVKGLGGFHLACDATDAVVVRRLKDRKRRPRQAARRDVRATWMSCASIVVVGDDEADLLASPEHPIVLLPWREIAEDGAVGPELGEAGKRDGVVPEVAVGQRYLGAMLPYTPLHVLLLREAGRPLVMTSGNLAEEPIVKGWEEIGRLSRRRRRVSWCTTARSRRATTTRWRWCVSGRPRLVRRSRGYAPFPVAPAAAAAPGARVRRGAEEHVLPGVGHERRLEPAHRRSGYSRNARLLPLRRIEHFKSLCQRRDRR